MTGAGPASAARRAPPGTIVMSAAKTDRRRRALGPASAVGRALLPDQAAALAVLPIARAGRRGQPVDLVAPPAARIGLVGPPIGQLGPPIARTGRPRGENEALGTWIGDGIGRRNGPGARRVAAHQPPGARLGRTGNGLRRASRPGSGHGQPDGARVDWAMPASGPPAIEAGAAARIGRPAASVPAWAVLSAPAGAVRPRGATVPVSAVAAGTGPIARWAGARDRRAGARDRRAGARDRCANHAPVHRVADRGARAGTISPARREEGSSVPLAGRAAARGGMMAARAPAVVPTGTRGRPTGPTPGTVAVGLGLPGATPRSAMKGLDSRI
jgi:hypothetical protein